MTVTVGVLALQGAFSEHTEHLQRAAASLPSTKFHFIEVRTPVQLAQCSGLVIPGGESTTMSLIASRCGLLEPLREFVKVLRKPTWGTCAGLILLAESANKTKKGGQDLIGGLDVRVNRNHFGRQVESFESDLDLPFLAESVNGEYRPFHAVFIRAPIVEKILPRQKGIQETEAEIPDTVVAPSLAPDDKAPKEAIEGEVEILARLPPKKDPLSAAGEQSPAEHSAQGDIIAVRQGNCFGTSFHPELTGDERIHVWWLGQVVQSLKD